MPSIGDITGRIVITDSGGPVVTQFAAKVEGVSNSILKSLSRATLGTETSVRQITAQLDKLKTQMKPTDSAKGLVADLDKLNAKVREEIAAVKAGPAAIDALNKKRYEQANALKIAAAQAQAGVSAESDLGKAIASNLAIHDRLQRELDQTAKERAESIAQAEREAESYRKVSQAVIAMTLAVGALAARFAINFLRDAAAEAIDAEKAFVQLRAGVESTGGAAGKSAEELEALAGTLSSITGLDDEVIAGGEAILLTFRKIRGEAFDKTMLLALDLSARFGKDIDSSVTMIAKALDQLMAGSTSGLSAMSKAGVTFTDQQKKTMEQLVKTGNAAEAQRLFFKELEAQFGGSAEAARDTFGGALGALAVSWSNLKEQVGSGGIAMRGTIEMLITVIDNLTAGVQLFGLGLTLVLKIANDTFGKIEILLRQTLQSALEAAAKLTRLNPFASDETKLRADVAASKARYETERVRVAIAERSARLEASAYEQVAAMLGILPKVQGTYEDLGEEIDKTNNKQKEFFDNLYAELTRQTQALDLFRQGMPVEQIENLVEAAQGLGKTNLLDPLVVKAAALKDRIDAIATAFKLADEAKKKFAEAGDDLDELIKKQFSGFGGNDPEMQKLIETLKEVKSLTSSLVTDEQKRAAITARVNQLYAEGHLTLAEQQALLIANAEQWNIELTESQVKFQQIFETISAVAEGMAYDLVDSWRSAWEQNESIVDATLDSLKTSFFNVLQDIISQWLSQWFRAMAAWLARWIATQTTAKAVSAAMGSGGGGVGDYSSLVNIGAGAAGAKAAGGGSAAGGGMSANSLAGYASIAYGLFVVYKAFFEDHRTKFANIEIIAGQAKITASHGSKYLEGVSQAANQILKSLDKFTSELNIDMEQYASIRINSSKNGVLVGLINSTGQTFKTMEEAIAYAQVLMLKYGEFSDSVSKMVAAVIKGTKAMTPDQLVEDINFAEELETQNRPELANIIQQDIDKAVAQWRRAKELFLQPFSTDLEAWGMAIDSIITKLSSSLLAQYNQLAGIKEDPETAWQRQKQAYNSQRLIAIAQLKLWDLEIAARIKNLQANGQWLGGLGGITRGTLKFTGALVQAAEVLDPALQSLLDIQAAIQQAINEIPPELTDANYPGKGKGGGKGRGADRKALRDDLIDEIEALQAEASGTLHSALYDLNRNLADFRERAKEAGLSAEQLATYTELMTRKFQESLRSQAEGYAGWGSDITRRLKEVGEFFDELRELGRKQTGMPNWLVDLLEGEALKAIGTDLLNTINQFAGLLDPMAAINAQADTLRANVLAYGTAVGWTAEQIQTALDNIDQGINLQRQQGINTALDKLFGYLKQAGLYQKDAIEFERGKAIADLALLEAQLRFYGAIDARTQEWLDAANKFVLGPTFGLDKDDVQKVRVVNSTNDWDEIVERIKDLVDSWREAVESFAKSTSDLMTDDELSPLTQAEQLEFARQNLESLAAQAQAGDLEALQQLAEARAEYLRELRESEAGGYGFDVGSNWAMQLTAEILENAQIAEQNMIATELAKTVEAWAYVMDQLADDLETTLYDTTAMLVDAIYDAISGVPSLARGGVVMNGPRLVRVAEYVPEAIVPLDRLAGMVPYNPVSQPLPASSFAMPTPTNTTANTYDTFNRDSLARLSALEITNERMARDMSAIRSDISSIARRK